MNPFQSCVFETSTYCICFESREPQGNFGFILKNFGENNLLHNI